MKNCQKGWSLPFDHFFVALRILEGDFGVGTNQPFPKAGKNHILLQNKSVNQLSDENNGPVLLLRVYVGDEILPSYVGIIS